MKIVFYNRDLFVKKLTSLIVVTVLLVPLIYYKLQVPAMIYLGALLIIHLVVLYIYFAKVHWRGLLQNRRALALRILGVVVFAYLLGLVNFQGDPFIIFLNLFAALGLHVVLLLFLMVEKVAIHDT